MHVIWHNNIAPDGPTVATVCAPPFVSQDFCAFLRGKNWSPRQSARCDEIDRPIDPNAFEPAQMLPHGYAVARIADPGQRFDPSLITGITDAGYNRRIRCAAEPPPNKPPDEGQAALASAAFDLLVELLEG